MSDPNLSEPGDRKSSGATWGTRASTLASELADRSPRGSIAMALSDFKFSDTTDSDLDNRTPSFFKKRFTRTWTEKHRNKDGDDEREDTQHRVGLRLLHSSPEPLIDLIFVHGLKGHPVKTWRKSGDPRSFWPQYWLPVDPGFHHVNIHTFGYEADWANSKASNILNIHDFGQSLLEEMRNSPCLRHNERGPIILLGHSLGGLVIKKAFNLATRDATGISERIRTIFFLGTPHRGSDYAPMLNNILAISLSSRDYLKDLSTGSTSIQLINDEFGRRAHDFPIFSFFETLKMTVGVTSDFIVPRDSAVLGPGFTNERVQYLNASHRDMIKFPHPNDDNYLKLKNALAGAVYDLLKDVTILKQDEAREQIRILKAWLSITDRPDEQHQHHKVEGTCQWIDDRDEFQEWRDSASGFYHSTQDASVRNKPAIIWVHANPGTGKTILATHVITELQELNFECSYYYFHVGSKASRSLGELLRSIAFQMALTNAAVRQKLVQLCRDGSTFDVDDDRSIWSKVFSKGIFQARVVAPQFWVVDALDECRKYQELFTMLKGEKPNFPLRIFITSRNVPDIPRLYRPLESSASLTSIQISTADTMRDIECYIQSRIENLPLNTSAERDELARTVLRRSDACFLWVRLVMDKLETVYSNESIMQILQDLPEGMMPYYERTVHEMADNKMEKHIAKAVLLWTVAGSRNMTTSELSVALKLDINTVLPSARTAIEGLCGQLVTIDTNSDTINVIHPTAREFLLTKAAGEFTISKTTAHERIAMTCFKALSSPEMQAPRSRRVVPQRRGQTSPFLDYAITQFSEHIYSASSETDSLLAAIDRFFRTTVLSWIEKIARKGDLHCLIRTSRNLKAYLDRRAKYRSPLNKQVKSINDWSTDLSRLVTKFGEALIKDPTSIYFIIPPLCPRDSPIYQQFGRRPDGLSVVGFKSATWDDCIASVGFGEDSPVAVSCGENLIAVSVATGGISLFSQQSCQKVGVLENKWPVDILHFAGGRVVVCTIRSLLVKDLKGNKLWEKRIRSRFILLTSSDDSVYAVTQHGHVIVYDMTTGDIISDESFEYRNHDVGTDYNQLTHRAPSVASISPDMETIAMGFRGGTVCLWDLPSSDFIGWARDDNDCLCAKMMFNPNPNIKLLLVIYTNHRISLFDTWAGTLVETRDPEMETGVLSAACSQDGRTFATTTAQGSLQIWDFESLVLLYHMETPFSPQRILNFTSDGTSIVDMSASEMRIWSPAVLIRKNIEEDGSISEDAVQVATMRGKYEPMKSARITALCAHPSLPIVIAGTLQGKVFAFSTETGKQLAELYTHSNTRSVSSLAVGKNYQVASSDSNTIVQVWKLDLERIASPKASSLVLQFRARSVVKQLFFSNSGEYLLVSTSSSDYVYSMRNSELVGSWKFESSDRSTWQWLPVPEQSDMESQFALICDRTFQRFSAAEFPKIIPDSTKSLNYELGEGEVDGEVAMFAYDNQSQTVVLDIKHRRQWRASWTTFFFDLNENAGGTTLSQSLSPSYRFSSDFSKGFIGISNQTRCLLFLDGSAWLSSIDLRSLAQRKSYTQHFFVPNEYINSRYDGEGVRPVITADDDVVFCLYGELVVIKNGTKFQDEKDLDLARYVVETDKATEAVGENN